MAATYLYDLEPGVLIETDTPLDEDQLEEARSGYRDGRKVDAIAKTLRARVVPPVEPPIARVAVNPNELQALLERAFPNPEDRERILEEMTARG